MGIIGGALKELVGGILSEAGSQVFGTTRKTKKQKRRLSREGILRRRKEYEIEHRRLTQKALKDIARAIKD